MSTPTSPRGAVNVGHSQLLQDTTVSSNVEHAQQHKVFLNARRKFNSCLESDVLDYLHYHPSQLEDCVKTLHTLFNNIVEHPEDPKYRRVSSTCILACCSCHVLSWLSYPTPCLFLLMVAVVQLEHADQVGKQSIFEARIKCEAC